MDFLGRRIEIIGAGLCNDETYGLVRTVGGLGGVMEGACRGAREAGGNTVRILPGFKASDANRFVSIPIVTGLSHVRNIVPVI